MKATILEALTNITGTPKQAVEYYTLRFAGLFNLPIPISFAFEIGVSLIKENRQLLKIAEVLKIR